MMVYEFIKCTETGKSKKNFIKVLEQTHEIRTLSQYGSHVWRVTSKLFKGFRRYGVDKLFDRHTT